MTLEFAAYYALFCIVILLAVQIISTTIRQNTQDKLDYRRLQNRLQKRITQAKDPKVTRNPPKRNHHENT